MFVHANLDPIKAYVREDVLFNMDESKKNKYVKCELIAVSSYPGFAPTFQIVVRTESIFSYIPPHLLFLSYPEEENKELYPLSELVYHNCPEAEFSLSKLDYLINKTIFVWLKSKKIFVEAKYMFTLDWFTGNDLLHCVVLSNGQIGFFPSHKISLNKLPFKPYMKLKKEWKV